MESSCPRKKYFGSGLYTYLILVSTASTGGGGLFSSRRTFFHREHGRYCFRKVYSENITHKIPYTPNKKLSTPTKKPSTPTKIPSRQTKRFSMINKTLIMPRKKQVRQQNIKYDNQNTKYANQNTKYANQKFTLFCREAIFVANLRTFLAYFLQAKKYGGVPKRTNIRYALGVDTECQHLPIYVDILVGVNTGCQHWVSTPTNISRRTGGC